MMGAVYVPTPMLRLGSPFVLLAVSILLGFTPADATAKRRGIQGSTAPEFSVQTWFNTGSKAPKVSDYRGKVLFLFFFQGW